MRKSTTKEDIQKYPCYFYADGKIHEFEEKPTTWDMFTMSPHHYIRQQWIANNPEKAKEVIHLQKIFFLPISMHAEIHNNNRDFKKHWGYDRSVFMFNEYELEEAS